jgi:hypothetical protein
MRNWWINNSWRFWAFQWVVEPDPYKSLDIWQEYRHMLNPDDERSLTQLILEEYDTDINRALQNPLIALLWRIL